MDVRVGVRVARGTLISLALVVASMAPLCDAGAATSGGRHLLLPPHEPSQNFHLSSLRNVLASIDAARASQEGLAPLSFDARRFRRLDISQQVFVLSNLERTTRGLAPAMAMLRRLDSIATFAAVRDADPVDKGNDYFSNWAGTPPALGQSAFFADFGWMYDDGPPPQSRFRNVDCLLKGQLGCWAHRDSILSHLPAQSSGCPQELVTGAGFAPRSSDGRSLTQIFEVACTASLGAVDFTWRHAVSYLKIPAAQSGLSS